MEKEKRRLEQQVEEQHTLIEELEDQLQITEDGRLRGEVNLLAAKSENERALTNKEQELEELKRNQQRALRDLEIELETERRNKGTLSLARKKLESDKAELEQQLDMQLRLKEDYNRQMKKAQQQVKDFQQEADEARQKKEELAAAHRDLDRKLVNTILFTVQHFLALLFWRCDVFGNLRKRLH